MDQLPYVYVPPLAPQDIYPENTVFEMIVEGSGISAQQGSFALAFEDCILQNGNPVGANEEVYLDPRAGLHSHFSEIQTTTQNLGTVETFTYYPRLVKDKNFCLANRMELATHTNSAIEGLASNATIARGYARGQAATVDGAWMPRVMKLNSCVNSTPLPLPLDRTGKMQIRIVMAPDAQVLVGRDVAATSHRFLRNVSLIYKPLIAGDEVNKPIDFTVYNMSRQIITTGTSQLSAFVPDPAYGFHVTFNRTANENALGGNYLQLMPLVGVPLLSVDQNGNTVNQAYPTYGATKVLYAISDTETALFDYALETQEEIEWNRLRSFTDTPSNYTATLKTQTSELDGYGIGAPFGGPMDFKKKKFSMQIISSITEPYAAYLFFPCVKSL